MKSNVNENALSNALPTITFYELLSIWFDNCAKGQLSFNTCRCYKLATVHLKQRIDNQLLSSIKERDIQKVLNRMAEENYAKSTIDKVRFICKSAFDYAVRAELLKHTAITSLKIPKKASVMKVDALTVTQQKKIVCCCSKDECVYGVVCSKRQLNHVFSHGY